MIHEQASTGSITQMLGTTGIYTLDVDNDAVPEILVGHTSMWYLLRYDPERDSFVQAHFHEAGTGCTFGCGDIIDLNYGDVDGDGELEVVVLFVSNTISVYDARTGNLEGSQALGISNIQAVATGELDPTIGSEIAVLTSSGVYVFSFGTTTPLWSNTSVGGVDMEIGNVDDDPAAEIVYTAGTSGALYAIDSTTHSIEYVYADGGDYVDVGDIDGIQEMKSSLLRSGEIIWPWIWKQRAKSGSSRILIRVRLQLPISMKMELGKSWLVMLNGEA
jgi:hypothetical protein